MNDETAERIKFAIEVALGGDKAEAAELIASLESLHARVPATRAERLADGHGIAFIDSDGKQALLCIKRYDSLLGVAYFKATEADLRCAGFVPELSKEGGKPDV